MEHVSGSDNVWSDILTRWAAPTLLVQASVLMLAPIALTLDASFIWPTPREIRLVQDAALSLAEISPTEWPKLVDDDLYRTPGGQVWIPPEAQDLQLRICVLAHTGHGGHRGLTSTTESIKAVFLWETLIDDVRTFCDTCLHCCSIIGGGRTPRPYGQALHASKPNEVIHFDFLFMGPSLAGYKYLLLIKDDLSGYLWLVPSAAADAAATVDALTLWFAAFGVATTWVSYLGSHFKNLIIEALRKSLRTQHHFTTAYTPWENGTVERACREVLRATRALLSEFQLRPNQWPDVARIVQSILNNSPSPQRGNIAPITSFTGREPDSPLRSLVHSTTGTAMALDTCTSYSAG
jgi:Integrase zinc binding domain